jgi:hypothetical protein
MCCFGFCSMFNSCNTLFAQFRLISFGSILFMIHMMHFQIFNLKWCMDHVLFNSRIRVNLDCHMMWVQECWFSRACSFSTEPESAVQLYSAVLSRVKGVYKLVLNKVWFEHSMIRLYHAVDWSILVWWCDFKQVVSCSGLTCLVSRSTGLRVPRHAVD